MTRTRLALFAAILVAVALVGAYVASPWMAVSSLRSAAKAGDAAKLERMVDFPAVRDSLKSQLSTLFMRELTSDPDLKDNPLAGLAAMLAPGLVNSAVDIFVTPDAISRLVEQGRASTPSTPAGAGQPRTKDGDDAKVTSGYTDLDTFRVRSRAADAAPGDEAALVLRRQGLFSWRLFRIDLPPSLTRP